MGRYYALRAIYFRIHFPYQIKHNYIYGRVKKLKEKDLIKNRRIEYLCLLSQYYKMKHQSKKDFQKIIVTETDFYIPMISDYCEVRKETDISYDFYWKAINEKRLAKWEKVTDKDIEAFYHAEFAELEAQVREIHKELWAQKLKNRYFVVKEDRGFIGKKNKYVVRVVTQDSCLIVAAAFVARCLYWISMTYLLLIGSAIVVGVTGTGRGGYREALVVFLFVGFLLMINMLVFFICFLIVRKYMCNAGAFEIKYNDVYRGMFEGK